MDRAALGPERGRPVSTWRRLIPLAVLLAGLVAFFACGLHRVFTFEALREHRAELVDLVARNRLVAALVAVLIYALAIALSLPVAFLMTPVCGFLFGLGWGTVLSILGATSGATLVFLAARYALDGLFRRRAGSALHRLEAGFRRDSFNYLLFLRLVPAFPFWLVNVVPALFRMRLAPFALATAIGIVPGALVYASVGAGFGSVLDRGEDPDWRMIMHPHILLPILGLAGLALVPVVYRHWKSRTAGE